MRTIECVREAEVIDAVTTGRWEEDLRAHAARCRVCADLAAVTAALQAEHAQTWQAARVPAAGLVWWLMELRARQEAARTAARPIAMAQAFAAACGLVLAFALLGSAAPWLERWVVVPSVLTAIASFAVASVPPVMLLPIVLACVASAILAPLALYLVFSDE